MFPGQGNYWATRRAYAIGGGGSGGASTGLTAGDPATGVNSVAGAQAAGFLGEPTPPADAIGVSPMAPAPPGPPPSMLGPDTNVAGVTASAPNAGFLSQLNDPVNFDQPPTAEFLGETFGTNIPSEDPNTDPNASPSATATSAISGALGPIGGGVRAPTAEQDDEGPISEAQNSPNTTDEGDDSGDGDGDGGGDSGGDWHGGGIHRDTGGDIKPQALSNYLLLQQQQRDVKGGLGESVNVLGVRNRVRADIRQGLGDERANQFFDAPWEDKVGPNRIKGSFPVHQQTEDDSGGGSWTDWLPGSNLFRFMNNNELPLRYELPAELPDRRLARGGEIEPSGAIHRGNGGRFSPYTDPALDTTPANAWTVHLPPVSPPEHYLSNDPTPWQGGEFDDANATPMAIAMGLAGVKGAIRQPVYGPKWRWPTNRWDQVRHMAGEGKSVNEIARELDVSPAALRNAHDRMVRQGGRPVEFDDARWKDPAVNRGVFGPQFAGKNQDYTDPWHADTELRDVSDAPAVAREQAGTDKPPRYNEGEGDLYAGGGQVDLHAMDHDQFLAHMHQKYAPRMGFVPQQALGSGGVPFVGTAEAIGHLSPRNLDRWTVGERLHYDGGDGGGGDGGSEGQGGGGEGQGGGEGEGEGASGSGASTSGAADAADQGDTGFGPEAISNVDAPVEDAPEIPDPTNMDPNTVTAKGPLGAVKSSDVKSSDAPLAGMMGLGMSPTAHGSYSATKGNSESAVEAAMAVQDAVTRGFEDAGNPPKSSPTAPDAPIAAPELTTDPNAMAPVSAVFGPNISSVFSSEPFMGLSPAQQADLAGGFMGPMDSPQATQSTEQGLGLTSAAPPMSVEALNAMMGLDPESRSIGQGGIKGIGADINAGPVFADAMPAPQEMQSSLMGVLGTTAPKGFATSSYMGPSEPPPLGIGDTESKPAPESNSIIGASRGLTDTPTAFGSVFSDLDALATPNSTVGPSRGMSDTAPAPDMGFTQAPVSSVLGNPAQASAFAAGMLGLGPEAFQAAPWAPTDVNPAPMQDVLTNATEVVTEPSTRGIGIGPAPNVSETLATGPTRGIGRDSAFFVGPDIEPTIENKVGPLAEHDVQPDTRTVESLPTPPQSETKEAKAAPTETEPEIEHSIEEDQKAIQALEANSILTNAGLWMTPSGDIIPLSDAPPAVQAAAASLTQSSTPTLTKNMPGTFSARGGRIGYASGGPGSQFGDPGLVSNPGDGGGSGGDGGGGSGGGGGGGGGGSTGSSTLPFPFGSIDSGPIAGNNPLWKNISSEFAGDNLLWPKDMPPTGNTSLFVDLPLDKLIAKHMIPSFFKDASTSGGGGGGGDGGGGGSNPFGPGAASGGRIGYALGGGGCPAGDDPNTPFSLCWDMAHTQKKKKMPSLGGSGGPPGLDAGADAEGSDALAGGLAGGAGGIGGGGAEGVDAGFEGLGAGAAAIFAADGASVPFRQGGPNGTPSDTGDYSDIDYLPQGPRTHDPHLLGIRELGPDDLKGHGEPPPLTVPISGLERNRYGVFPPHEGSSDPVPYEGPSMHHPLASRPSESILSTLSGIPEFAAGAWGAGSRYTPYVKEFSPRMPPDVTGHRAWSGPVPRYGAGAEATRDIDRGRRLQTLDNMLQRNYGAGGFAHREHLHAGRWGDQLDDMARQYENLPESPMMSPHTQHMADTNFHDITIPPDDITAMRDARRWVFEHGVSDSDENSSPGLERNDEPLQPMHPADSRFIKPAY